MNIPNSTKPRFFFSVFRLTKPVQTNSTVATGTSKAKPKAKPSKPVSGTALPYNALDKIAPEPAGSVKVQVFNASTARGAATQATNQLSQDGLQQQLLTEAVNTKFRVLRDVITG